RDLTLADANRPRERHNFDLTCACISQHGRGRVGRRAGRVNVVDERHAARRRARDLERSGDVPAPLDSRELALPGRTANTHEQRLDAAIPDTGQLPRELLRRMMATAQAPVGVGRYEGEDLGSRAPELP